jgi:hypothetical protein
MIERGANVFRSACEAADPAAFVENLQPYAWRDLYSWLLLNYSENGISGEVLGIMLVEGARRYMAACPPKQGGKDL